jgi:hypothetical protein
MPNGFVFHSTSNDPTNEKETKQYNNSEALGKLLEEIALLREIISLLQSERTQDTHPPVQHEDDNNWCQAARGKTRKNKKVTQYLPASINNRFNMLNGVTDEAEQRKAPSCPKVDVKTKSKLMFYSDSYGRDIPTSLSKISVDLQVSGEVRPGGGGGHPTRRE